MSNKTYYELPVTGMHCASCELLLTDSLNALPGVKVSKIDRKRQLCCVEATAADLKKIKRIIEQQGYTVKTTLAVKNSWNEYLQIIQLALIMGVVFYLLNQLGLTSWFPDLGEKTSLAIAFLIGLVASVSTCFALIGGLVLGLSTQEKINSFSQHGYFHLGRLLAFFLIGGTLGLLGQGITYSFRLTGWLTIIVAFIMLYLALKALKIIRWSPALLLPTNFYHHLQAWKNRHGRLATGFLGFLTVFLPCGFTQSMMLAALATGSFWGGATLLAAFVLGTTPVLWGAGWGASWAQVNQRPILNKVIGLLILFFSLYSLNSGLILAGSPYNFNSLSAIWNTTPPIQPAPSTIVNNRQIIRMTADGDYEPSTLFVQARIPVRWIITGKNLGCNRTLVVPTLNLTKTLSPGENIIDFDIPSDLSEIPFSCSMGMVNGKIIVVKTPVEKN